MFKKLISLLVIFAMLIPFSSAVAADNSSATPSIEDILNEYHQKSFHAQVNNEANTVSTYSRQSSDGSTSLEQEAVHELTDSGYTAYNVTTSNYNALEDELNSDFSEMGLDPNGSYIVVISGEENNNEGTAGARIFQPPTEEDFGDGEGGGIPFFQYTYNGTTYAMRYVTVTGTQNNELSQTDTVDLLDEYGAGDAWGALSLPLTIASFNYYLTGIATMYSLLSAVLPNINDTKPSSLKYTATAAWTVTYTQIYDNDNDCWELSSGVEYVLPQYFINYHYYDGALNRFKEIDCEGDHDIMYSRYYTDKEYIKERAVLAFERGIRSCDVIDGVNYIYNNKTVLTIDRWMEYSSYEPA